MSELLAPAGSFNTGKIALYSGADAIYLAYTRFGARAYATNFSLLEIEEITKISHVLNKKVYVVINTLIKDSELAECYELIDELYKLYVDGLIVTDIAIYNYLLRCYPMMECHISTQVGVKNYLDVKFFENIGAKRVVLARETSIDDIEFIKKNTNIALEVFIHGALCVSYSGGCLLSSMLSLRSGNRGRCSQNCRREYMLFEDGKKIQDKCYLLSMKDLNSTNAIKRLVNASIDSLKIEGRMKNSFYVSTITKHYRSLIDEGMGNDKEINQIFHRKYTKGFLQNEDNGNVSDITSPSNEGRKIGKVISFKNNIITLNAFDTIRIGDRIRFEGDNPQYLTITNLIMDNEEVYSGKGTLKTKVDFKLNNFEMIYKMIDSELNDLNICENIIPITCYANGSLNNKLQVTFVINDKYFTKESDSCLDSAMNKALNEQTLYNQLSKLGSTPFYLDEFYFNIEPNLFISLKEINEIRRKLVEEIYSSYNPRRTPKIEEKLINLTPIKEEFKIIATASTQAQYDTLKDLGIEEIYFKNKVSYTEANYKEILEPNVLVSNYGSLLKYKDKIITTDYAFNVLNYKSVAELLNLGVKNVTLSYELSKNEIIDLANNFKNHYGFKAPLEMVIYGYQNLMSLKYCPLKALGLCGKCKNHRYDLKDDIGFFHLTHEGCITHVLNGNALNLINEINVLKPYINIFRLDFTIEGKDEIINVVKKVKDALAGKQIKLEEKETRGYYNRKIM